MRPPEEGPRTAATGPTSTGTTRPGGRAARSRRYIVSANRTLSPSAGGLPDHLLLFAELVRHRHQGQDPGRPELCSTWTSRQVSNDSNSSRSERETRRIVIGWCWASSAGSQQGVMTYWS